MIKQCSQINLHGLFTFLLTCIFRTRWYNFSLEQKHALTSLNIIDSLMVNMRNLAEIYRKKNMTPSRKILFLFVGKIQQFVQSNEVLHHRSSLETSHICAR